MAIHVKRKENAMFKFTSIDRSAYEKATAKQAHRASEPRDTIFAQLVSPFIDANIEVAAKGITDDGELVGYTWNDMPDAIVDQVALKEKDQSVSTLQAVINQTQNRERWHVYCKVVKNPDNSVGFALVNLKLEKARRDAEKATASQPKADTKADAA